MGIEQDPKVELKRLTRDVIDVDKGITIIPKLLEDGFLRRPRRAGL